MALSTSKTFRNQMIYSVFVRNYSEEGTFAAVEKDLDRIRSLGTDIIWLMPIHPTGEKNRKGSLGSPYAIKDYRAVNPEYGTLEDFVNLTKAIHAKGMKVIIDVVYNHTSPDSVLAASHPEWFYKKPDGSFGNKTGDWWDVIDLDYASGHELWDYQIETLVMWANYVDGFRCDVASLVPVEFWIEAREAVAKVRPGAIWLAESVHGSFLKNNRSRGIPAWSDAELYQAFDIEYEYDIFDWYLGFLEGKNSLAGYCREINKQEEIYPGNYCKVRYLENHDQPRAHFLIPDETQLRNWTAFMFFQKGTAMVYAGQEKGCTLCPDLFDKDTVKWTGHGQCGTDFDLSDLIRSLKAIKNEQVFTDSSYCTTALPGEIVSAVHTDNIWQPDESAKGIVPSSAGFFSLQGRSSVISLADVKTAGGRSLDSFFPDGIYKNRITGGPVEICRGKISIKGEPVILMNGDRKDASLSL